MWVARTVWFTIEVRDHKFWEALVCGTRRSVPSGVGGVARELQGILKLIPGTLLTSFRVTLTVALFCGADRRVSQVWAPAGCRKPFPCTHNSPKRDPNHLQLEEIVRMKCPYVIWQLSFVTSRRVWAVGRVGWVNALSETAGSCDR